MSTAPRSLLLLLCCTAAMPSKLLHTEEPAVHEQACNHGNRGRQITKMSHSKLQQHKPWLFYFWPIQLNYINKCLMQITVYIQSNKQYSSHHSRWSYHLIISRCHAMLLFWSMSNGWLLFWSMSNVSLNQFNHFRAYWTQTNVITARSLDRHFC